MIKKNLSVLVVAFMMLAAGIANAGGIDYLTDTVSVQLVKLFNKGVVNLVSSALGCC